MKHLMPFLCLFILRSNLSLAEEPTAENKCIVEVSSVKVPPSPALIQLFKAKGYEIKIKQNDKVANFSKELRKWNNVKTLSEEDLASLEDRFLLISLSDFKPMCQTETRSFSFGSLGSSSTTYNCSYLQIMFSSVQDKKLVRVLPLAKSYANDRNTKFKSEAEAYADIYKKLDQDLPDCSKIRSADNMKKTISAVEVKKLDPNEVNSSPLFKTVIPEPALEVIPSKIVDDSRRDKKKVSEDMESANKTGADARSAVSK